MAYFEMVAFFEIDSEGRQDWVSLISERKIKTAVHVASWGRRICATKFIMRGQFSMNLDQYISISFREADPDITYHQNYA